MKTIALALALAVATMTAVAAYAAGKSGVDRDPSTRTVAYMAMRCDPSGCR